jgi:Bacterial conjugation TrbI-like protein
MKNTQENYINELIDEELTPKEELEISGYQPEQVALIDQEFLIQRDSEQAEPIDESENPLIRFAIASLLVGGVMGFGWMVWSIFFASKPVVKAPTPKETPTIVASGESDEAARLKAELALRNQASRNLEQPQKQVKPERIQPVTNSKVRPVNPPAPRIIRERIPSPPRIIRETVTVNKPQSKPVSVTSPTPKVEKIDPFERWNQLATLGQQTIKNSDVTAEKQITTLPDNSTTAKIPEQSTTEKTFQQNESTNIIPAVAISNSQTNSPITLTNKTETQTPGEWGILNRTNPNIEQNDSQTAFSEPNSPMQIQIGTTAKGDVVVPLIWTQEGKNRVRFAVRSQEDIRSTDNRVVFPKGTVLIVDVDSVSKANKLVQHSVVAIIYKDKLGQVKQQQIPQGVISIQTEDNKPLIAQALSDKGKAIAQQDILIGLLGATGRAGEIFNQNQSQSSSVISNGGLSSQIVSTKANKPNILGAAVEGFFKPMSQRLSQRADKASSEISSRQDVAILPINTKVSIFFNNFLEVSH